MMLDMRRSKLNWRPLYCHGAKDKQDHLQGRMGPEAAMSQHAMEANRQAKRGDRIHRCKQG